MKKRQLVDAAGPLSSYAQGFREKLERRGYAPDSVRVRLRQFTALDRWLGGQRLAATQLDAACVDRLVSARRAEKLTTFVAAANFAVPIAYLREIGVVPAEASSRFDPASRILDQYRNYLVTERGLAESSIPVNMQVAKVFCNQRGLLLEQLSAAEVTAYIAAITARSSIGWSKKTVSSLASFLRFLYVTGVTAQPLATALPRIAGHRTKVPCELDESDFDRLLAGCDRSLDVGLRDSAILTILWRLGLRRSEVARLRVDDINWRRGEITIRGKGNHDELLPLPTDVGEAIVRYVGAPRPVAGCAAETSQRIITAVMGALAQAVPDRVPAGSCATVNNLSMGGVGENGDPYVMYVFLGGGYGGHLEGDGLSNGCSLMSIGRVQSIETIEQRYPIRFKRYGLREGSAGHGRTRGGYGVHFEFELTGQEAQASLLGDQAKTAPAGHHGGTDGHTSSPWMRIDGKSTVLPMISKGENVSLRTGDVVCLRTPGGAGYGRVEDRPFEVIQSDLAKGYLSEDEARHFYPQMASTANFSEGRTVNASAFCHDEVDA